MTDTGAILKQGLTLGELFAVGVDDHVVTIPVSDIFPDQTGHGGEFLQTDGFGNLSWDSAGGGGGGTVTTVSVVTANGVSGSVANATTTPAITLTLGAITPSSVAAVGTVTGSNLSGTNTGDQTITLTSDVTGSGTGSFATTIANNAVTYAKMQAISATSKLLGSSSTTTPVQEITLGSGLSLTGTTLSATGSGGTVTTVSVVTVNGVSGSVATATTTPAITLTLGAITPTSVAASGTVTGSNLSGTNTGDQTSVTGNAGTATALQTARNINGVAFDGTASITVTAAAGTLTGTTLNSSVVTSSLTAVGTIATGVWNGTTIAIANGGTGQTTAPNAINALLPSQTGNNGKFLTTDGSVASWGTVSAGVTSITGTANQVIASASTGAVTLSTPQSIATSSTPQFARLGLGVAADATAPLVADLSALTTTNVTGLLLQNSTASTSGSTRQTSPMLSLAGHGWTSSDVLHTWSHWVNVINGSQSTYTIFSKVGAGALNTRLQLDQAGLLTITNLNINLGDGILTIASGLVARNLAAANSIPFGSGTGSVTANSTNLTYSLTGGLTTKLADALTNTVADGLTIGHNATGTQANGFGSRLLFNLESSTTVDRNAIGLTALWTDATDATRSAALVFTGVNNAAAIAEWGRFNNGLLTIGVAGTLLGQIGFSGSTSGTTTLKAAAAAGGTFTLPAADGTVGQALITNGSGVLSFGTASTKVFSNTSVPGGNTIANTVVETAFSSSYTIPANALAAGNVLRLKMWGVYSTDVIAPTLRMKVKLGSTVILDSGAVSALVGASTNLGWSVNTDLSWFTIGASGTVDSQAVGEFATAAAAAITINEANTATTTIDTTATQAITVTITWGTANASNTITMRQFTIEWLK